MLSSRTKQIASNISLENWNIELKWTNMRMLKKFFFLYNGGHIEMIIL